MSMPGSQSIADVYKGVINDVINQVKEAFLDENVDIDVLSQLKKEWEEKVTQSGRVDLEPRHHVGPPPMRHMPPPVRAAPPQMQPQAVHLQQHHVRIQPTTQQLMQQHGHAVSAPSAVASIVHLDQPVTVPQPLPVSQPRPVQYIQQHTLQGLQSLPAGAMQFAHVPAGMRMMPQPQLAMLPGGHPINIGTHGGVVIMQNASGQHIPITVGPNGVIQPAGAPPQQRGPQHDMTRPGVQRGGVPQLDGNAGIDMKDATDAHVEKIAPGSSASVEQKKRKPRVIKMKPADMDALMARLQKVMQLDGGGGMSDSSSEDEEAEDDDDPLRRIADRIGDGTVADGDEAIQEEDPLNSGDDQSDDEDLNTLFDADNVIMCQFEKVHRARSKWKFSLKDGIMHINGKDYCFQKCTGEAEW